MSQTTASPATLASVPDLLEHLDEIPADRIRLQPAPGTATE